jgi:predicted TIM-barrel fold metal-dependent hydrolase
MIFLHFKIGNTQKSRIKSLFYLKIHSLLVYFKSKSITKGLLIMFIDIHTHITYGDCPELAHGILGRPPFTVEVLLKRMDMEGIDKSVVLPLINPEVIDRYGCAGNQEVLRACQQYPDRLIPFCAVDPRNMLIWGKRGTPGCMYNLLKIYQDLGCKGIGEMCATIPIDDPRYGVIYEAAGELGMPILFHIQPPDGKTYGAADEFHLPGFENILKRYPQTMFIGHSMAFWSEISGEVVEADREKYLSGAYSKKGRLWELFEKYPNIGGDISAGSGAFALKCDPVHGAEFLEKFQDKLYFGTDRFTSLEEPIPPQKPLLDEWLQNNLISKTAYEKISHLNAEKLLNL